MRTFYDIVETHIRGLSSLEKSEHWYGDLLIPAVMEKLPVEVQRNPAWEHSNSASDLMVAILKEIRILETGPHDPHKSMLKLMAAAFHSGNWSRKQGNTVHKKPQCVFCKKDHPFHNWCCNWLQETARHCQRAKFMFQLFGSSQGISVPFQVSLQKVQEETPH